MNYVGAMPAWSKWAGLGLCLALSIWAACWLNVKYFINPAVNAETARWQSRWDQRDLSDKASQLAHEINVAQLQTRWQADADEIQKNAQDAIERANKQRSAVQRDADRLREQVAAVITRLQQQGDYAATGTGSTSGQPAGVLLARLFDELAAAAGNYAAEAKRARDAGLACEAQYDAIRGRK